MAMVAANMAVAKPMIPTRFNAIGARSYNALLRAIIYIPAVTMVAACISADTGVGPAIASGNHVYRGICALLPIAPIKKQIAIQLYKEGSTGTAPLFSWPKKSW